jgi:hypothetical protein
MAEGMLVVTRNSRRDIKIRDLYLLVDDVEIGNVAFGGSIERPFPAGEHTLTVTNRLYSQKVTFDLEDGQRAEFEAANIARGCGGLLFVVVGMGPYQVSLVRTN